VIPGSVRDFCLGCDRPIWVAPTGQQLKANGALLYCVPCGMRRMGAEGERVAMMTPEQLVELRQAIGGGAPRPSAE
jgi:hypothetical protein